jgi:hypothetical protein
MRTTASPFSEDLAYLLRLQYHVLGKEHRGVHSIPSMVQISAGDNKAEHQTSRVVPITLLVQAPKR